MNTFFSIIIPAYNSQEFLNKAVESVINQTYNCWELLLIDDCSSDNTRLICENYEKQYKNKIKFYRHSVNKGASGARNTGIENSTGKYIVFLDSDDYLKKTALSQLYNSIENNSEPDMIVFGMIVNGYMGLPKSCNMNSVQGIEYIRSIILPEQLNLTSKKNDIYPFVWNKAFRSSLIKNHNICFNEAHRVWEDKEFVLWFLKNSQTILITDMALYYYETVETDNERLSEVCNDELLLSQTERCRNLFERFDDEYSVSKSVFFKNYMFNIMIDLCVRFVQSPSKQIREVLCTVFQDELVKEWAVSFSPNTKIEKKLKKAVVKEDINNIEVLIDSILKNRKRQKKYSEIGTRLINSTKRGIKAIIGRA